jgi:DNA-binding NtrC family response regulator
VQALFFKGTSTINQPRSFMLALVVDDDSSIRSFVRAILLAEGFQALDAQDGQQALEIVRASGGGVDLMISDIQMPGRDGIGLAREVMQVFPAVAIILMSGHPAPECDFRFIQKPFSWMEMRGMIRRATRNVRRLPPAA